MAEEKLPVEVAEMVLRETSTDADDNDEKKPSGELQCKDGDDGARGGEETCEGAIGGKETEDDNSSDSSEEGEQESGGSNWMSDESDGSSDSGWGEEVESDEGAVGGGDYACGAHCECGREERENEVGGRVVVEGLEPYQSPQRPPNYYQVPNMGEWLHEGQWKERWHWPTLTAYMTDLALYLNHAGVCGLFKTKKEFLELAKTCSDPRPWEILYIGFLNGSFVKKYVVLVFIF